MSGPPTFDDDRPRIEEVPPEAWQEAAARLRAPLTVVLARSQLLQRRIRTGQVWDASACLETLEAIDAAVREAVRGLETRLREIETERR